jgi:serpin B
MQAWPPAYERKSMTRTKSISLAVSAVILVVVFAALYAPQAAPPAATESLVTSNNAFAFDLYSHLSAGDGNLFFSPYSISSCLAITYTGARGDTAAQMAGVLHFDADPAKLSTDFAALQKQLARSESKGGTELNLANGLWAQQNHPFLKSFLNTAEDDYSAKLNQVDFHTRAEPTRLQINDWVSDQTRGKIKDLLPSGSLDESTRLVLVNAIYFKGRWAEQFKKEKTRDLPFHVTADRNEEARLMNIEKSFKYAETDAYQLVELPYKSGSLAMVVVLPKQIDGLKKIEASLDATTLNQQIAQAEKQDVEVFLPKFKITAQFSLAETLKAMGMPTPFTLKADFSGMDGERDLSISAVLHKAYVDLDEEGTEAAAATGTTMMAASMRAMPPPHPIFRADHPFIFFIRDTQTGAILFLGRITDPTR